MNNLCADVGYVSLNKFGEQLCGDHIETVLKDDMTVIVLADGLGSGVKANILSTLTAKIISTMMANDLSVEECVSAIAATLPICKVREIAYSTFTILRVVENEEIEIIQYDNPHVILLREGKNYDYSKTSEEIDGKTIYKSKIRLQEDDTFLMISDGAVHAGVGRDLNFGWLRKDIIQFMEAVYREEYTAKTLSSILIEQCRVLYAEEPGDDTTVCALKIRERKPMNLLIGPPADPQDVSKMMSLFFARQGQHIVCGGTTSALAAEYLQKPLLVGDLTGLESDIPPMAAIEGADLVTEGIITVNRVLEYAKDYLQENKRYHEWGRNQDGASRIARMLFEEATDINFFVGKAVNPAHQNPNLPIGFNIKMKLIDELAECLKQMGKKIRVSYF
ncbi:SpoIIE family protein phosphatase [Scatolibacter rhodanostii]|uniref:SpoIIE family protein phosphatase n=1 Tax=Scatolibacter rhodanostii TaxID=2014781 RepID=UPI000C068278|nr:SpoIIE family protein phosphatase [Scatolibacter rhodanostii]